jgi:hypothetical protein
MPFTFLLALGAFAMCILWFVDVEKSRAECRKYLEEEAIRVYELTPESSRRMVPGAEVLDIGRQGDMDGPTRVVYEGKGRR